MEGRTQHDAVSHVKPVLGVIRPREDVRRFDQLRNRAVSDRAGAARLREHGAAEEVLTPSDAHLSHRFGFARKERGRFRVRKGYRTQRHRGGVPEDFVKREASFRCELLSVFDELREVARFRVPLPHDLVGAGSVGKAPPTACSDRRVQEGEVRELHRRRPGRAFQEVAEPSDAWRVRRNARVGRHAVERERERNFFFGPGSALRHREFLPHEEQYGDFPIR